MTQKIDRRHFLKATSAVGAVSLTAGAAAQQPSKPIASPADLSIAEKLAGVNYTDAERVQIYEDIDDLVDRVRQRREGTTIGNDDAPALVFDPRLPGETYKRQSNRVVLNNQTSRALPSDEDIAFSSISEQGYWLRSGQITASKLLDIYLTRIKEIGPKLECFITLMEDSARAEAYKADTELRAGRDRGPLHGIPYGMKDLADTAGIPTTYGATPYKNRVPKEDAVIVKRLRDAGAVLVGKTSLGALAYGDLWWGGLTKNPWNTNEGSSGSSAGSASSTAAALVSFSIGTETLGSIVSPSNRCGTTGLRPTFGRVPRSGSMALCWSLDKFGPICRHVDDTALVLAAINGQDDGDPSSIKWGFEYDAAAAMAEDIVIGFDPAWFEGDAVTPSEKRAFEYAKNLGFKTREVSLPSLPYGSLFSLLAVEAAAAFEELTLSNNDDLMRWQKNNAWPNTFRTAHFIPAVEAIQLDRFRRQVMQVYADLFKEVDVLLCPHYRASMLVNTNFTGQPCIIIPVGLEKRASVPLTNSDAVPGPEVAVPHGFTLWGNTFREDQILAVASLLEHQIGFKSNRPKL